MITNVLRASPNVRGTCCSRPPNRPPKPPEAKSRTQPPSMSLCSLCHRMNLAAISVQVRKLLCKGSPLILSRLKTQQTGKCTKNIYAIKISELCWLLKIEELNSANGLYGCMVKKQESWQTAYVRLRQRKAETLFQFTDYMQS